jgi:hypothetical protein
LIEATAFPHYTERSMKTDVLDRWRRIATPNLGTPEVIKMEELAARLRAELGGGGNG